MKNGIIFSVAAVCCVFAFVAGALLEARLVSYRRPSQVQIDKLMGGLASIDTMPTWFKEHELAVRAEYDALARWDQEAGTNEALSFAQRENKRIERLLDVMQKRGIPRKLKQINWSPEAQDANDGIVVGAYSDSIPEEQREQAIAFMILKDCLMREDATLSTNETRAYLNDEIALDNRQLSFMKAHPGSADQ